MVLLFRRVVGVLRRPLGVRMRSALAAGLTVAVVVVLAGGVLLATARSVLMNTISTAASDRAGQIGALVSAGGGTALETALRPTARDRSVVQVLDASGTVAAASDAITGIPPISSLRPAAGQRATEQRRISAERDDPFLVVAYGVSTATGTQTVLVAESLDTVSDGTGAVVVAMLLGLPLLALAAGAVTFWFAGRSLLPVEAMRRQADTITARNLHARLPEPGGTGEIAALAATMNTMLDRIESASDAQRRFVADASHELRSPLATIHANADLLGAVRLPPDSVRPVQRIQQESARMARLVDDLLVLARADDQGLRLRRLDVDLDDLVFAERERLAVEHPGLQLDGPVEPVRVTGDPDQLHRVLRNLADNAARHARTRITVSLSTAGDVAQVAVGNDGPAIAVADRERIFDRFVRLDSSRSRQDGGSGLGLPIARDIVTAHGGTIAVIADATFLIRLPLPAISESSGTGA